MLIHPRTDIHTHTRTQYNDVINITSHCMSLSNSSVVGVSLRNSKVPFLFFFFLENKIQENSLTASSVIHISPCFYLKCTSRGQKAQCITCFCQGFFKKSKKSNKYIFKIKNLYIQIYRDIYLSFIQKVKITKLMTVYQRCH